MGTLSESELIINKDGSIYHLNLKPGDVSDTIIAVGDPGRVYMVSQYFDSITFEMNKREFITHTGIYKGKKLTVISTGMGTDNIEIFLTELDALFNIDFKTRLVRSRKKKLNIIRIGTSGALQEDIQLGTHLVSEYGVGLDTLMHFYKLPQSDFERKMALAIQAQLKLPFTPYLAKGSDTLMKNLAFDLVKGNTITSPGFYAPQGREIRLPIKNPSMVQELSYFHNEEFWITNFEMETAGYYSLCRLLGHEMLSVNAIVANRVSGTFSEDANQVVDSLIRKILDRI